MRGQIRTVMGRAEWMLLVLLGALWGGSYFFGKVALADMRPFTVAVCRLGIAAVVLNLMASAAGLPRPGSARRWRALFLRVSSTTRSR